MLDFATEWFWAHKAVSSVVLVGVYLLLRWLTRRMFRSHDDYLSEDRRRLLSYSGNALVLFLLIGLVLIWAPALRTFALSITAFMVALVIATKELILCITGGMLRTFAGSFSIGDWIRVGEQRGEVVDQSFLSVTLQELDGPGQRNQFTGRTVVLPNSVFLSMPAVNENFYKRFVYHTVEITLRDEDDPIAVATLMRDAMGRAIADSSEVARRYNALIRREAGVAMPPVGPTVRYATSAEGRARVGVTAFVPTAQVDRVDRDVMGEVLSTLHRERVARASGGQATTTGADGAGKS